MILARNHWFRSSWAWTGRMSGDATICWPAAALVIALAMCHTAAFAQSGMPTAGNSQLTARPGTINADGLTIATVTVTLKDETNTPVSGKPVTLTQGAGHSTITPPSGTSDSYGEVTFRVSNSTPETVTYTAVDTADSITVTQQGIVSFTPVQGAPPAVTLSAPSNGATVPSGAPTLSWGASEGATSYNVYLGTSNPPGLAATVGTTTYTGANDGDIGEKAVAEGVAGGSGFALGGFGAAGAGAVGPGCGNLLFGSHSVTPTSG